jgi:hypothetical protein
VIDVGDNGKITDKGQFGHEPPLAGLPCPFKHGGTPVSRYVNGLVDGGAFRKVVFVAELYRASRFLNSLAATPSKNSKHHQH